MSIQVYREILGLAGATRAGRNALADFSRGTARAA
jgi:hypothetical protein